MLNFISAYGATIIISFLVFLAVYKAARYIHKTGLSGSCAGCSMKGSCHGNCSLKIDDDAIEKMKQDIANNTVK